MSERERTKSFNVCSTLGLTHICLRAQLMFVHLAYKIQLDPDAQARSCLACQRANFLRGMRVSLFYLIVGGSTGPEVYRARTCLALVFTDLALERVAPTRGL